MSRYERRGDAVGKVILANGQDRCPVWKRVFEANPENVDVTAGPRARKSSEVIGPQAAEKSLYPDSFPPVPHTDTGRQREHS